MEFLTNPGMRERHLKRQYKNPLFEESLRAIDEQRLKGARYMDEKEQEEFIQSFHQLLEEVAQLKPNEGSEKLLELKSRLDQSYEFCSALGGEHEAQKQAIVRLVEVIMASIWQSAQGDAEAEQNLHEEALARKTHFHLLQYPLIADLLRPRSPIAREQLVATLLSESAEALDASLTLFDKEHIEQLFQQGLALLDSVSDEYDLTQAETRLEQIRQKISQLSVESG